MSKWKLRRPGVVLRGTITSASIYQLDGDQNILVRPDPEFSWTLVSESQQANPGGQIECEVEILDRYENDYLDAVKTLLNRPVTAYGVWVEDLPHAPKTELHPVDAIIGRLPDDGDFATAIRTARKSDAEQPKVIPAVWVHRLVAGSDDSWTQHPPLSDATRSTPVTVPFPPKPSAAPPAGLLSWKPRWEPKFRVRVAVDIVDSLADDGNGAALTLRIAPKSYTDGGPGALVMDVATFWSPAGKGDIV